MKTLHEINDKSMEIKWEKKYHRDMCWVICSDIPANSTQIIIRDGDDNEKKVSSNKAVIIEMKIVM